ncbi:MAG: undecaprenyl phosphate translocase family protein [Christensenellales bacterium]
MFLLPIGIGAVLGIVAFSKLIEFLLTNYPVATNFFFIGLILGSIPMIFKRATRQFVFQPVPFLFLIGMLVLASFSDGAMSGEVVSQLSTGILSNCWSVLPSRRRPCLPGVSGSMVMVILGTYNTVLTAISSMNILMLVPVGIGVLAS